MEKSRAHTVNARKYLTKVEFEDYLESMRKKIDAENPNVSASPP